MEFIKTKLSGVFIIEPIVFGDDRGYFYESFNQNEFENHIGKINFIQDNESKSSKGVLRGLHFQKPPFEQSKLVRCTQGKVLDVVVDLRKESDTYGDFIAIELSNDNKRQLFIPKGFAHGFVVLSDTAIFTYKVDNKYSPDHDSGIYWADSDLRIDWKIDSSKIILSKKDQNQKSFKELNSPF